MSGAGRLNCVSVLGSGNPYPSIFWQHSTEDVEYDERIVLMADNSLKITAAAMSDAGSWMVTANNDLGKVVRKQISVTIYPSSVPIQVSRTPHYISLSLTKKM